MEKTNKKIIVLALILSIVTSVLVYFYIKGNTKTTAPQIEYATVYVAVKTIPARSKITSADVKMVNIARELLNASAVTDINEISGKYAFESIIQGEQIIKERLADEKSMMLSFRIPEGMKAVRMNVNEQLAVAGFLRPGDFVDIVVSFEKEAEENGQAVKVYPRITKTVFQNVKVLALGQDITLPSAKLAQLPGTITLAIKNEEVDKFVYATEYGILRMALRPVDDNSVNSGQGIMRGDMTGQKGVYTQQSQ